MERQQRIAVVPGSFDPITKGHMDIIRRAKPLFDKVIVLVVINAVKNPCFSLQERVELIRASVADIPGVEVDCYKGLLVDSCPMWKWICPQNCCPTTPSASGPPWWSRGCARCPILSMSFSRR